MIENLTVWFSELTLRERILLGIAAILSASLIAIYGLYIPLNQAIHQKRIDYREALEQRAAIEMASDSVGRNAQAPMKTFVTSPLDQFINQSATEAGFAPDSVTLDRIGRVSIILRQARSPAMLKWLAELERNGVGVEQIEVKAGTDGTVSVSATLARNVSR